MRKFSNPILNIFLYCSIFCLLSVGAMALTGKPLLIQPAASDTCVAKTQRFIWHEEVLINNYVLQVSTDALFQNNVFDQTIGATFADITLPNYNTRYWWRVIVRYQNSTMDTSYVQTFKTILTSPSNFTPLDFSSCELTSVKFTWDRPTSSTKYRLQVSDSLKFETVIKDTLLTNVSELKWNAPGNNRTYFWRIRTEQSLDCASEWSLISRFTTTYQGPTPVAPANNVFGLENASVKLVWNNTEHESFGIRVSKTADMASPIVNQTNYADTSFVLTNLDLNTVYYWQVNAVVRNSCTSDWSNIRQFTTKYKTVTLLSPSNQVSCLPKEVKLIWNSIPTARSYSVQVSNNSNFPDTVSTVPGVQDTTIVMNGLSDTTALVTLPKGLTTYYWRVKASDVRNFGNWSDYRQFTTTYASPVLVSPVNNAEGGELKVDFKWNREFTSGEQYIFQLATSPNFETASRLLVDTLAAGTISFTLPQYSSDYYWRVAVLNVYNCQGTWSSVYKYRTKLSAPTLLSPLNRAVKQEASLVLEWSAVTGADKYDMQISTDSTFKEQNIVFSLFQMSGTKVSVPNLGYNTKYYWHARAKNDKGTSNWSNFFVFTTNVRGAEVPELIFPQNTATKIAIDTTLIWKASARATSYKLEIATDNNFSSKIVSVANILTTTYKLNGLKNYTNYYWHVAAVNDSGATIWSEVYGFRIIAKVPANGPDLLYPVQDSIIDGKYIQMRWSSVETCDLYQVQLSTNPDFATANLVINDEYDYKTIKEYVSPTYGTKYYWRVLGINEAGKSPWSVVRNFTIKGTNSVEDVNNGFKAVAMPNPARDNFDLTVETPENTVAEIVISDASGRNLKTINVNLTSGQINKISVNTNEFNSGVYFVTIITPFSKLTEKISIAK